MPQADPLTITEVTLGELYRLLTTQGQTLDGISTKLEKRPTWTDIDRLEAARDTTEAQQNNAIKKLEDGNTWLVRTVGAALVTALGTALVVATRALGI